MFSAEVHVRRIKCSTSPLTLMKMSTKDYSFTGLSINPLLRQHILTITKESEKDSRLHLQNSRFCRAHNPTISHHIESPPGQRPSRGERQSPSIASAIRREQRSELLDQYRVEGVFLCIYSQTAVYQMKHGSQALHEFS